MNIETHSSIWGYKEQNKGGQHTHGTEDLDMERNRIINLGKPNKAHHAATMSYVSDVASHLKTHKVNVSGDTMIGNLDMNYNRITSVADPINETDVVNKKYADGIERHEHDTRIYDLGRYIVFPHEDGTKVYISVRARKNINLQRGKLFEIKNNIADSTENEFNNRPNDITIIKDVALLPNPNKDLGIVQLNSELRIDFTPPYLPTPCTFLFSARPGNPPLSAYSDSILTFYNTDTQIFTYITIRWELDGFKYAITDDVMTNSNSVPTNVNIAQLNHISFQCVGSKLNVWLNGKQIRQHNVSLGSLSAIRVGVKEVGILSLYNRDLNKQEIVQHFVDHHVENFTNDEVLI